MIEFFILAVLAQDPVNLVRQLGHDDPELRESATRSLVEIGSAADRVLREALQSSDPEVAARAAFILEKIGHAQRIEARRRELAKGSPDLARFSLVLERPRLGEVLEEVRLRSGHSISAEEDDLQLPSLDLRNVTFLEAVDRIQSLVPKGQFVTHWGGTSPHGPVEYQAVREPGVLASQVKGPVRLVLFLEKGGELAVRFQLDPSHTAGWLVNGRILELIDGHGRPARFGVRTTHWLPWISAYDVPSTLSRIRIAAHVHYAVTSDFLRFRPGAGVRTLWGHGLRLEIGRGTDSHRDGARIDATLDEETNETRNRLRLLDWTRMKGFDRDGRELAIGNNRVESGEDSVALTQVYGEDGWKGQPTPFEAIDAVELEVAVEIHSVRYDFELIDIRLPK